MANSEIFTLKKLNTMLMSSKLRNTSITKSANVIHINHAMQLLKYTPQKCSQESLMKNEKESTLKRR